MVRLKHFMTAFLLAVPASLALTSTALVPTTEIGPLVWHTVNLPLISYPATDQQTHVTFITQFTNASHVPVKLEQINILNSKNGLTGGQLLGISEDGRPIDGMLRPLSQPSNTSFSGFKHALGPGQTGMGYFDIRYQNRSALPEALKLAVTQSFTLGKSSIQVTVTGPSQAIDHDGFLHLGAPLKEGLWLVVNGSGPILSPHRATTQAANGQFHAAEQFAIDFIRLKKSQGRYLAYQGDISKPDHWFCYGEPILSASAGQVVSIADNLPDQVPVGTIKGMRIDRPDDFAGNRVIIDAGKGQYLLYAHLQPGSVRVKLGQTVRIGQPIGRIGNSGNSDAPHLHFQVMNSASVLNTTSLPFVFNRFQLIEHFPGRLDQALDQLQSDAGRVASGEKPSTRLSQMPLTLDLIDFSTGP